MTNPDVVTITVNPALDLSFEVNQLVPDHKMRAHSARREAGGGGVNVSRVLKRLDVASTAFVAVGGPTGRELVELIETEGLDVLPYAIEGNSRESVAITETTTGRQYRSVLPGPPIPDADDFFESVHALCRSAKVVVISGNGDVGLPNTFINDIIEQLGSDVTTIIDTFGEPLKRAAEGRASILKPSQRELEALVGWVPSNGDQIEEAARAVLDMGQVGAIVASRGPSGALLVPRSAPSVRYHPPLVKPVSTVGAGDSMVAGMATALVKGQSLVDAVSLGVAAGTAAVITPGTELCQQRDVDRILAEVLVTRSA